MPKWPLSIKILIFFLPLLSYMLIEFYFTSNITPINIDSTYLTLIKFSNLLFAFICLGILGAHFNYAGSKTEEELDSMVKKMKAFY